MTDQASEYRARHRAPETETTEPAETPGWASSPEPEWYPQSQPQTEPLSGPETTAGPSETGTAPTRGSTRGKAPRLDRLTQSGLTEAARYGFMGIGEGLNGVCAEDRKPPQEPDDIWIPTEDEADGVARPAGRILARKLPEVPGGDANDAADLIALLIPLGIWAVRGIAQLLPRLARNRRQRSPVAEGQVVAPETE